MEVATQALQVTGLADPFDDGSSGLLSNYTTDMKTVINTHGELQPDTYYLFVIDKPASGSKLGYMPRAKKVGFIFAEPHGSNAEQANGDAAAPIINTMAHELGHGVFTLKHTFSDYSSLVQGSTDNLMDYNNSTGSTLWKYQWDKIHDPAVVLGLFEGDAAGAKFACPFMWFSSSGECESVGKILDLIKNQMSSGKKITVNSPTSPDRAELIGNDISLSVTKYKTIRILNLVDKSVTFDPSSYEDYNQDFLTKDGKADKQFGFSYKVDGKVVVKILLVDIDSALLRKKEKLRKYLFDKTDNASNNQLIIEYGPNANKDAVKPSTIKFFNEVMGKLGITKIYISSTSRDPNAQARVMFDDLYGGSPDTYRDAGTKVQNVYYEKTKDLKNEEILAQRETIITSMKDKIVEVGPINVSKHASDPEIMNVVDIPLSYINDQNKGDDLVNLLEEYKKIGWFDKLLYPGNNANEAAYHFQINVLK